MSKNKKKLPTDRDCAACGACAYVCPKKRIEYPEDAGFFAPIINNEQCINCDRCINVCPKLNRICAGRPIKTFAAVSNNIFVHERCSSGGIAEEIALEFIKKGGVVYGAEMTHNGVVAHVRIDAINDLYRIRGSKYVRSNLSGIYKCIHEDLYSGTAVLFIGTPCQSSAIKNLFCQRKNLYIVDLVCHGTVPGSFFKNYLGQLIDRGGYEVRHCEFRGLAGYCLALYDKEEKQIYRGGVQNDLYFNGFYYGWLMSRNCFSCEYASIDRVSDVTLGDFWGLGTTQMSSDLTKGVSLVLINSEKGGHLFENISCEKEERTLDEAVRGNPALHKCERQGIISKWFYWHLKSSDFIQAMEECTIPVNLLIKYKNSKMRLKELVKRIIG